MTSNILADREFLETSEFLLRSAVARHASPGELMTLHNLVSLAKRPHTPEERKAAITTYQQKVAEELAYALKELRQQPTWVPKRWCDKYHYLTGDKDPKKTIEKKRYRA